MLEKRSELLSVHDAAEALGVTVACLRRWVLERKISYVKLGRLVRISSDELDRMIAAGTCPRRETNQ